jgi:pentatricopeptide repeat protein
LSRLDVAIFCRIASYWGLLDDPSVTDIASFPNKALSDPRVETPPGYHPRTKSIFDSIDEFFKPSSEVSSPYSYPSDISTIADDSPHPSRDRVHAEFSSKIKDQGRKGDLHGCWESWNRLIRGGYTPNEITLGCMVDALVSNREVNAAEMLVHQWKQYITPNTVVYSTLIHGWAKNNDAKNAMQVFERMRAENVPCNAVTFNCLIHACIRVGDIDGGLNLLHTMKQPPNSVQPDKFTYSTIIKGYCGRGDMETALMLFECMLGEGLTPDLVIYNTLLDGCVRTRYHDICDKLLNEMLNHWSIHPNSYTLSILIKRFGRQGDLLRAFQLVDSFPRQFGFRANAHVWTCLISACVAHGFVNTAEIVFRSMSGEQSVDCGRIFEELQVEPTADAKYIMKSSLALAATCTPDAKTYETLILGYLRFKQPERAAALVRDVRRHHVVLSSHVLTQVATSVGNDQF